MLSEHPPPTHLDSLGDFSPSPRIKKEGFPSTALLLILTFSLVYDRSFEIVGEAAHELYSFPVP